MNKVEDKAVAAAAPIPSGAVECQLERILASQHFVSAPRLNRFLTYIVEQSLAGLGDRLKGYTIGLEVFDRPEDFDPQTDTIVRVQAGKLRRRLELYYAGEGNGDPLHIFVPKGSYEPAYQLMLDPEAPVSADKPTAPASLPESSKPSVAVLPFQNYSGDPRDQFFADGLTEETIANLARFKDLSVFSRSTTAKLTLEGADIRKLRDELGVDFVVEGSVRKNASRVRVTLQLIDAATDQHIFAERLDRPFTPEGVFEIQDEIALLVSGRVADRYGPLGRHVSRSGNDGGFQQWETYNWITKFYDYQTTHSPKLHLEIREGLERCLQTDTQSSDGWAALSLLLSHEYGLHLNERENFPAVARAIECGQRAKSYDPENAFAYQALAMAHFHADELEEFEIAAKRAVELNPGHADVLADVGFLRGMLGDWKRGLPLSVRAIELSPVHPGWYHLSPSLHYLVGGDPEAAYFESKEGQMPGFVWYHALLVACLAEMEDERMLAKEKEALLAVSPDFAELAQAEARLWLKHDETRDITLSAWRKAGFDIPE